jgi:hypothetical protein
MLAVVTFFPQVNICLADTLVREDHMEAITILSFDRQEIHYRACGTGAEQVIPWSGVSELVFDPHCMPLHTSPFRSPFQTCADNSINVFLIKFRRTTQPAAVENITLTRAGLLHLDAFEPWEQAHGPIGEVQSISRQSICRNQSLKIEAFPSAFCHEPRQIAVAFDYEHPFDNRILTNGFSFSTTVIGRAPYGFNTAQFIRDVRDGFQFGISAWTSGLVDHGELLSPAAKQFIAARTSSSNNFKLFLPPQIIALKCPQNATFVVALVFKDASLFPRYPLALARAKIEGRTIALNMHGIPCFHTELKFDANRQPVFETSNGCVNLIPVLTHELGHAFGLKHSDSLEGHSVMDSYFSRDALAPTALDIQRFVAVLNESIEGAAPGKLQFVSSSGVRPPIDWVPGASVGPLH